MGKGWMDILIDSFFDADWVGRHGEKLTERELNLVRLLGRKGKILRNVYIPKDNGETSEIDVLFVTQKGIFVIESKNYSGWVFGDESSQFWTVMLPTKEKNRLYNPIKQNQSHIKWLGRFLDDCSPLFSLIVFSERCELKKVTVKASDVKVIKRDRLYATVREIWNDAPDALSEEKIDEIYTKLKALSGVDAATKQKHIDAINEKLKSSTEAPDNIPEKCTQSESRVCPRCGDKLVLRTAKKGANAGSSFYGCSGFPKCRYIEKP